MPPVATLAGYRSAGHAIVTVQRQGRPLRRYRVSLKRYRCIGEWLQFGEHHWLTSGAWLRNSMTVTLWEPST